MNYSLASIWALHHDSMKRIKFRKACFTLLFHTDYYFVNFWSRFNIFFRITMLQILSMPQILNQNEVRRLSSLIKGCISHRLLFKYSCMAFVVCIALLSACKNIYRSFFSFEPTCLIRKCFYTSFSIFPSKYISFSVL